MAGQATLKSMPVLGITKLLLGLRAVRCPFSYGIVCIKSGRAKIRYFPPLTRAQRVSTLSAYDLELSLHD